MNKNTRIMLYGWKDKKPFVNIENRILFIGDELRIYGEQTRIEKIYSFSNTIICYNITLGYEEEYTIEGFYKALKDTYSN